MHSNRTTGAIKKVVSMRPMKYIKNIRNILAKSGQLALMLNSVFIIPETRTLPKIAVRQSPASARAVKTTKGRITSSLIMGMIMVCAIGLCPASAMPDYNDARD